MPLDESRPFIPVNIAVLTVSDTRTLAEKSAYEQSFVQCQYIWEDFPDVRPLTFHPAIGELTAAIVVASPAPL